MAKELRLLVGKKVSAENGAIKEIRNEDGNRELYFIDLSKAPHMLVAGTTGSGKSNLLNWIVLSQCALNNSDELKVYLGDPKKVEFMLFDELPHVVKIANTAVEHEAMLDEVIALMEQRYARMKEKRVKSAFGDVEFPNILVVIDEFGDLVLTKRMGTRIEEKITKLVQMGRAAGITLVLATQNPIEKVVDSRIKGNCPTRACFKVSSGVNSRVILDRNGGEHLIGNGHMLLMTPYGKEELVELQAVHATDEMVVRQIDTVTAMEKSRKREEEKLNKILTALA